MVASAFPWLDTAPLTAWSLVLARLSALLATAPVLGAASIPMSVRAGVLAAASVGLCGLLPAAPQIPATLEGWLAAFLSELALGALLGLGVQLAFAALRTGSCMRVNGSMTWPMP